MAGDVGRVLVSDRRGRGLIAHILALEYLCGCNAAHGLHARFQKRWRTSLDVSAREERGQIIEGVIDILGPKEYPRETDEVEDDQYPRSIAPCEGPTLYVVSASEEPMHDEQQTV